MSFATAHSSTSFADTSDGHVTENPSAWGYDVSQETGYFIPAPSPSDIQPFKVHLFGGLEKGMRVPPELEEHVLVFRSGLDYVDYYRELSKLVRAEHPGVKWCPVR